MTSIQGWGVTARSFADRTADHLGWHAWWRSVPRPGLRRQRRVPACDTVQVGNVVLGGDPGLRRQLVGRSAGHPLDRIGLLVGIDTPPDVLSFCCTHRPPGGTASAGRKRRTARLAGGAADSHVAGAHPFVLGGDVDAVPEPAELPRPGGLLTASEHAGRSPSAPSTRPDGLT